MALFTAFSRRLYLRIWLAVVAGVAALALVVGWAWRVAAQYNAPPPAPREVMVRNLAGELIGSAQAQPGRQPGQPLEFTVNLNDGQTLVLQMPPRNRRLGGGPPPPPAPYWTRPPYGFFWMLGVVGLAVALGVYPIVRRLTQRLEALQRGVQRWGDGDLSVRVPVSGQDEVADLAQRFNAAAERIQTLMASQQALLAAQKSLLANASHELRSPLTRIRMGLELLGGDGQAAASAAARRGEISRSIAELDQLIDEILLASRLDARADDPAALGPREEVDLIGLAAEECSRTGAELQVDDGSAPLLVQGHARLLRRLLRNLLENARRHGRDPATGLPAPVTLRLGRTRTERGPLIRLAVEDQGPGVPASHRERIFEPFFRLPGASEREGGVGLGLSLVRTIAQRHAGTVRCEERQGGGARFVVELQG